MKIHDMFHMGLLSRTTMDANQHFEQPLPVVVESGEEEYEVEAVIDSKRVKNGWQYHIRWKGYGPEEDTWEPKENLVGNAKDELEQYHRAQLRRACDSAKRHQMGGQCCIPRIDPLIYPYFLPFFRRLSG